MRLKEDRSSWKSRGIVRRDVWHDPSEPRKVTSGAKKKNTTTWCKGKKGVAHQYCWGVDKLQTWAPSHPFWKERCTKCGRIRDVWLDVGEGSGLTWAIPESLKKHLWR